MFGRPKARLWRRCVSCCLVYSLFNVDFARLPVDFSICMYASCVLKCLTHIFGRYDVLIPESREGAVDNTLPSTYACSGLGHFPSETCTPSVQSMLSVPPDYSLRACSS